MNAVLHLGKMFMRMISNSNLDCAKALLLQRAKVQVSMLYKLLEGDPKDWALLETRKVLRRNKKRATS